MIQRHVSVRLAAFLVQKNCVSQDYHSLTFVMGSIWPCSSVAAEMQTGGICAYVAKGGLITLLLIYMPFLYVARSSDL